MGDASTYLWHACPFCRRISIRSRPVEKDYFSQIVVSRNVEKITSAIVGESLRSFVFESDTSHGVGTVRSLSTRSEIEDG